jgi:prepilin signal peptidase PulO-like enzyme (type II secretory pathway)
LIFLTGLIGGSFINLLSYRLARGESLFLPRSRCDHCGQTLALTALIPVAGYLWHRGKCRRCAAEIPRRYPLTELTHGGMWLLLYWQYGFSWYTLGGCALSSLLTICAATDLSSGYIFDVLTYPGILLGLMFSLGQGELAAAAAGMLLLGSVYGLVLLVSRGGMGGGDVKMGMMIGAFCRLEGAFLTFILSAMLAAVFVLVLIGRKKAVRGMEIRFGTFLAAGGYLAYGFGEELMAWYMRILTG